MSDTNKHGTRSIFNAVWHNRWVHQTLVAGALGALLAPIGGAQAATLMQPADFNSLGNSIWSVVCKFIQSPIVAVVIGISILALLMVMAMNEDNGMLSKVIKVVIAGMAIVFLPSIMILLGFKNLTGC